MCVLVRRSARVTTPWDPASETINIPTQLTPENALTALRAVLAEMGIPQPDAGAVCWCGDPTRVPPQSDSEVIARGA